MRTLLGCRAPAAQRGAGGGQDAGAGRLRPHPRRAGGPRATRPSGSAPGARRHLAGGRGPGRARAACLRLGEEAVAAVRDGACLLVISDAAADGAPRPCPSRRCWPSGPCSSGCSGEGLATRTSVVADTGDAGRLPPGGRPARLRRRRHLPPARPWPRRPTARPRSPAAAQDRYRAALEEGVFKIMSKMGISVLDAYRGAQIFEAVGLDAEVVDLCFAGTPSPLGGIGLDELAADALDRAPGRPGRGGRGWRTRAGSSTAPGGEYHATNPEVMQALALHGPRRGRDEGLQARPPTCSSRRSRGAGSSATGTTPAWSTSGPRPPCATCWRPARPAAPVPAGRGRAGGRHHGPASRPRP